MKKIIQLLAHLIPLLALTAVWYLEGFSFSVNLTPLLLLAVCFIACPLLGVLQLSGFVRGLFYVLTVFAYSGGIFAFKELGGEIAAFIMLAIGTVSFGILLINRLLPGNTAEETLLKLRGMKVGRARKSILLKQSFSSFFRMGGILFSILSVFCLLITKSGSPDVLWSSASLILAVSLLFHLIHCVLDTSFYEAAQPREKTKKGKYVLISVLSFCLILIAAYVYVGTGIASSDPSFATALRAVQTVLSPALLAALFGFICGTVLGYILSLISCRFFQTVFQGVEIIPVALFAGLLYHLLPPVSFIQPSVLSIAIPSVCMSASSMLRSRAALMPYKNMPIHNRKQTLLIPFVYLPMLSIIPVLLLTACFASIFIDVTTNGVLCNLADFSFTLTTSVLAVITFILLILSLLTKEARHHD